MSYAKLYEACQKLDIPVSRTFLAPKILELSGCAGVRYFRADLDIRSVLGLTIWPGISNHPFAKHCKGRPVVIVARGLDEFWWRFVVIKELMHLFDTEIERCNTAFEFEALVSEFGAPLPDRSIAMSSEIKCLWRALGVICPEGRRQELQRQRLTGELTDEQIGQMLEIPLSYVPVLFTPEFKTIITEILEEG